MVAQRNFTKRISPEHQELIFVNNHECLHNLARHMISKSKAVDTHPGLELLNLKSDNVKIMYLYINYEGNYHRGVKNEKGCQINLPLYPGQCCQN